MNDRGIIKWKPFKTCLEPSKTIKDIKKQKNKLDYPILSEDQLNQISFTLYEAYHLQLPTFIKYFFNGEIFDIKGIIQTLNPVKKIITINNKQIYLIQIINIEI